MCKNNVKWNQAEFKSTCIILQIIHTFCQIGEHVVLFVSHVNLAFCRVTCTAPRTSDPPTCSCDCLVVMQGLRLLTAAHQVTVQSHYPPTVGRTVQKAPESTLLLKFVFERLLNLFFGWFCASFLTTGETQDVFRLHVFWKMCVFHVSAIVTPWWDDTVIPGDLCPTCYMGNITMSDSYEKKGKRTTALVLEEGDLTTRWPIWSILSVPKMLLSNKVDDQP